MKAESLDSESDGALIGRFADERDERAFATIVERRGALVGGVCARMLRHREDAEDAFQAVFLVLARRARALRKDASLSGWLHEVAVRICKTERGARRRRGRRVQEAMEVARDPTSSARRNELKQVLDEELAALPKPMREVLILCDLEGHSQLDAARRLSVPVGTVSSRLVRGRAAMRKRLMRNGITIAATGVSFALANCAQAAPHVSPALVQTTTHNAHIFAAGNDAMKSTLGTKIITLANGALSAMVIAQWKTAACLVLLLATSLVGGAVAPALVTSASAGTYFYDDFEDGSVTDGSPVTWIDVLPTGSRTIDDGAFALTPDGVGTDYEMDVVVEGMIHDDVSLRTSVRADPGGVTSVFGRYRLDQFDYTSYAVWGGIRHDDGLLQIAYVDWNGFNVLERVDTDLDVMTQDVHLQLDVFGDTLSLTAWAEGEARPAAPQLTANIADTTDILGNHYDEGKIGMFVLTRPGPAQPGTHRFAFFQAAPSSEPNTDGDTNFDGQVDLEDLNAVRNHFGEGQLGGPRVAGDAYPFDGIVDLGDLNLVRNHFGAGAEGIATPEPAAASLAGAGIGLLLFALLLGHRRYGCGR